MTAPAKGNAVLDVGDDRYDIFLRFWRESVEDCGWPFEALALEMGISKGRLSDMLAGRRELTVRMALRQPRAIYALMVAKCALHLGVPAALADTARAIVSAGVQLSRLVQHLPARAGPGPKMALGKEKAVAATTASTTTRKAVNQ